MSAATLVPISAAASPAPQGAGHGPRDGAGGGRAHGGRLQRSGVRRFVAALMVALFALSCGESLIADVCDGDELAKTAAVADSGSATPTAQRTAADGEGTEWRLIAHLDDATSDHVPAQDRPHGVHVCHCVHAHNGLLSLRTAVVAAIVPVTEAHFTRSDRLPPSPALEPQLRPPAVSLVA
jgi:hypothetical protein